MKAFTTPRTYDDPTGFVPCIATELGLCDYRSTAIPWEYCHVYEDFFTLELNSVLYASDGSTTDYYVASFTSH